MYLGGAVAFFAALVAFVVYGVWFYRKMKRLAHDHMKAKIFSLRLWSFGSPLGQALACSFCYGAQDRKKPSTWRWRSGFCLAQFMSVLGGSRRLWFSYLASWPDAARAAPGTDAGRFGQV